MTKRRMNFMMRRRNSSYKSTFGNTWKVNRTLTSPNSSNINKLSWSRQIQNIVKTSSESMDPIMSGLSSVETRLFKNVFVDVRHFGVAEMVSVKIFVGVDTY